MALDDEFLKRFGSATESINRLARKAHEAEQIIRIHGVSATAGECEVDCSIALRSDVALLFVVHDTPTRRDPMHRTIELPKPLTQAVVDSFNRVFARMGTHDTE